VLSGQPVQKLRRDPPLSVAAALEIKEEFLIYIMRVLTRYSPGSCLPCPVDTSVMERITALAFVHLSKVTLISITVAFHVGLTTAVSYLYNL
jgi:hypothetical protein